MITLPRVSTVPYHLFPAPTLSRSRPCAVSPCGQTTTWLPARDSPAPSASAATVASHICCPLVALRSTIRSEKPPGVGRLPLLVVVQDRKSTRLNSSH